MNTQRWILVAAAVLVAAAGGYFISQTKVGRTSDPAPITATPTRAEIDAMPAVERAALMEKMMAAAAAAPDRVVAETLSLAPEKSPLVVATGRFRDADADRKGSGNVQLIRLSDGSHVLQLKDFAVTNGPALVVALTYAIDPQDVRDAKRSYLRLGDLQGNKGNRQFAIPASVNVGLYRSVVIWCDLFDVLFASATLNAT